MVTSVLGILWWVVTLPFRLVFGVVGLFGRLTALAVGFLLMVLGVAFLAGPIPVLGIPMFVVGLLVSYRSLE